MFLCNSPCVNFSLPVSEVATVWKRLDWKKKDRDDMQTCLLPGTEQMWERITPEKYEGGLPASWGPERMAVAQRGSTVPGVHAIV